MIVKKKVISILTETKSVIALKGKASTKSVSFYWPTQQC